MSITVAAIVAEGAGALAPSSTARLDSELLLCHLLGWRDRSQIFLYSDQVVDDVDGFKALVKRRKAGEPVAYITGEKEFWSLAFKVTPDTLIPRPDTETMIDAIISHFPKDAPLSILDLGTGSGCILLTLLNEFPNATGVGVDISPAALTVAAENAQRHHLANRSSFIKSDWLQAVTIPAAGFDLVVSNPPYIPSGDIDGLMQDVRDFEPLSALDGGGDGLGPYRYLTKAAGQILASNGMLAVEHGFDQGPDIVDLFQQAGLVKLSQIKDLSGHNRIIYGFRG